MKVKLDFTAKTITNNGYKSFIKEYETELIKRIELERFADPNYEVPDIREVEITFLKELFEYQARKNDLILRYTEHREKLGKYDYKSSIDIELTNQIISHNYIMHFIEYKLLSLGLKIEAVKKIYNKTNVEFSDIKNKKSNKLLVEGVKLNISERYKIANEILDVYKTINEKNISATEKHTLLAHILGCSQQVARELFNGTQQKRTPTRDEVINPYLKKLE